MNKQIYSGKLLPIWIALSAVIILAGIILAAVLGFNFSADQPDVYRFEVKYDTAVTISETAEADMQEACEDAFAANGISYSSMQTYEVTAGGIIEYTFSPDTAESSLKAARDAVQAFADGQEPFSDADITVVVHTVELQGFYTAQWRGAVAIGVAAIAALIYVAVRFGISCALSGLCGAVNSTLLSVALLAIFRIPVYGYTPLLFAAASMFLTFLLWTFVCAKLRENAGEPAYAGLSAEDYVAACVRDSRKTLLAVLIAAAVAFLLLGGLATSGVMVFFLPALLPVAVSAYSSFVLIPAVHTQIKGAFDRAAAARKRYDFGKGKKTNENN